MRNETHGWAHHMSAPVIRIQVTCPECGEEQSLAVKADGIGTTQRVAHSFQPGDCVALSGSSLLLYGIVTDTLEGVYVRVRWQGASFPTTHSYAALAYMESTAP